MSGQLETMALYRAGAAPCPSDRFDDLTVRILGERLDGGGAHIAEHPEPEDESGRRRQHIGSEGSIPPRLAVFPLLFRPAVRSDGPHPVGYANFHRL